MSNKPTALVVGAQGLMGTRTVEVMQGKGWNVFRGGRNKEDAADFRYIDLNDKETFAPALEGVDVIFNVVQDESYGLEKYVLENGGLLANSTMSAPSVEQLKQQYPEGKAKGSVVLGCGLIGPIQLAAKKILDMDRSADTLLVSFNWECKGDWGGTGAQFVKAAYTSAKQHPTTTIDYGAPVGAIEIPLMQLPLVSESVGQGVKQLFAAGYDDRKQNDTLLYLNEHQLLDQMPADFYTLHIDTNWVPGKPSREHCVASIDTYKGGDPLFAGRFHYLGDWYSSAVCNWMISDALLNGHVTKSSGAHDVGDMFESYDELEMELARNCVTLEMVDKSMAGEISEPL